MHLPGLLFHRAVEYLETNVVAEKSMLIGGIRLKQLFRLFEDTVFLLGWGVRRRSVVEKVKVLRK